MSTPPFPAVLNAVVARHLAGARVALPGSIVSYDDERRRAVVQPGIRDSYLDVEGERRTERMPPLVDVPVVCVGSGGRRFRYPIAEGDNVLLLFASSSIDVWLQRGGVVDPLDDRHHDLNDAIALCGLDDFAHAGDADVLIDIDDDGVRLGSRTAVDSIMRKSDAASFMTILATAAAADVSGTLTILLGELNSAGWLNSIASIVKAD